MRWEDRTLKAVEQEERGDREEREWRRRGGDRISVTLKSKQGNEYQGSLQDGC